MKENNRRWYHFAFDVQVSDKEAAMLKNKMEETLKNIENNTSIKTSSQIKTTPPIQNETYTAYINCGGNVIESCVFNNSVDAILFGMTHNWDTVVNDRTREIIWSRFGVCGKI